MEAKLYPTPSCNQSLRLKYVIVYIKQLSQTVVI